MKKYVFRYHASDPDSYATHEGYGGRGWYAHHSRSGYIFRGGPNYGCFFKLSQLMDWMKHWHDYDLEWLIDKVMKA